MRSPIVNSIWGSIVFFTTFTGCLSTHENLYTLDRTGPPLLVDTRLNTIVIGPVSLPQLVDRPQLVVREDGNKVRVIEAERWATPLKESLPRLLAEELDRQVPSRRFLTLYSSSVAEPVGQLAIEISRFDAIRDKGAHIVARWVYRPTGKQDKPMEGASDLEIGASEKGYEGLVQSLQRASFALADDIAKHLVMN